MAIDAMVDVMRHMLYIAGMMMLPPLATALLLGLGIGLLQAITSIQEQTLSFVPKIVGIAVVLVILGPWMLRMLIDWSRELFSQLAQWGAL